LSALQPRFPTRISPERKDWYYRHQGKECIATPVRPAGEDQARDNTDEQRREQFEPNGSKGPGEDLESSEERQRHGIIPGAVEIADKKPGKIAVAVEAKDVAIISPAFAVRPDGNYRALRFPPCSCGATSSSRGVITHSIR